MSKYIIEIEDVPFSKVRIDADNGAQNVNLYRAEGFNSLVFDQFGLDKLTPLDKELEEAYQKGAHEGSLYVKERVDGAYQKGYEVGQHEATTLEYQCGLNDAWECAKRIALVKTDKDCPYFTVTELEKIFGCSTYQSVFDTYSASEAIEKIKVYEERQKSDEIKVGDEVIPIDAIRRPFVVVSTENNVINGFDIADGYTPRGCHRDETRWEKTGRHFPLVEELVNAMKEGAE